MSERTITEQPHIDESYVVYCHKCREKRHPTVTRGYDRRGIIVAYWVEESCSVCGTYSGTRGGFYD